MQGDPLEDLVQEIQADQDGYVLEKYGRAVFERWSNPAHRGAMENPHGQGSRSGECGDTIQIFLEFQDGWVSRACFVTDGCASSVVCGSMAAELAHGRAPDQVMAIDPLVVLEALGGLPEGESHCAFLAAGALHDALDDYLRSRKD